MKDLSFVGLSIINAVLALNVIISNRTQKTLSTEQKLQIADLNVKMRIYIYLFLTILVIFFTATLLIPSLRKFHLLLFIIAIVPFQIGIMFVDVKKLKRFNLLKSYIKTEILKAMMLIVALLFWLGLEFVESLS
jgi:hypothetical protein